MRLVKFESRKGTCAINPDLVVFVQESSLPGETEIWSVADRDPVKVEGSLQDVVMLLTGETLQ